MNFSGLFRSDEELLGKAVVISGCDSGFGRATALQLQTLGFVVYAGCYSDAGIDSLVFDAAKEKPGSINALKLDVTSDTSVDEFLAKVTELAPQGVFCVISNAGIGLSGFIEIQSLAAHRSVMEVNYFGTLRMLRAFSPLLRLYARNLRHSSNFNSPSPRFITISSLASKTSAPLMAAYCASKHAVRALTDVARVELNQFGIQVTQIEPFFAKTPIVLTDRADYLSNDYNASSEEIKAAYKQITPEEYRIQTAAGLNNWFVMEQRQV
ncbi:hypothetical protein HK100_005862, partial [Physocladia obscura]